MSSQFSSSQSSSQSHSGGVRTHQLPNGLTIVGESLPEKRATAWTFLLPAGGATEPQNKDGMSGVLESLSYRGAGQRDSRQLSDALDDLGIDRGGGADIEYSTFGGATLGAYFSDALGLYADILQRPQLLNADFSVDEFEAQRALSLQALESLDDNPARKMFVQLRRVYFPDNYGRSPLGTRESLENLTLNDLRADHAARYKPQGAILALAGEVDFEAVVARCEELFGDWSGIAPVAESAHAIEKPQLQHIAQETSQQHIGVAWSGVASDDAHFYNSRVAMSVLSGGMGARLFTEVREKRGLVYSVSSSAGSVRGCGYNLAYAGTTPERSQETLDVLLHELRRMKDGVTENEVERAKIGMLSGLVMQEESSRARTGAIARDQFVLGRVRTLDEVTQAINSVSPQTVADFYQSNPPQDFTVVTLGPRALEIGI